MTHLASENLVGPLTATTTIEQGVRVGDGGCKDRGSAWEVYRLRARTVRDRFDGVGVKVGDAVSETTLDLRDGDDAAVGRSDGGQQRELENHHTS